MRNLLKCGRSLCVVFIALVVVAAVFGALRLCEGSANAQAGQGTIVPFTSDYYSADNQRFGVGLNGGITITVGGAVRPVLITDYDVANLHIGWYSDWSTNETPLRPDGIAYAQLILVRASAYPTGTQALTGTVQSNPGSLWIVGNEPEAEYGQGNRTPAEYAVIYHDVYACIKSLDPSAWVAIGGVIETTPLRLQWLDLVLAEYQARYGEPMPIDVWNIHVQILREKRPFAGCDDCWGASVPAGITATQGVLYDFQDNANPLLFRELVTSFRRWMRDRGFQNKPLIVSEYGVLLPSDYLAESEAAGDQRVIDFMHATFDFLVSARDPELGYPQDGGRLVQQWLWYSLNDHPFDGSSGFNGSLYSYQNPRQMTPFGIAFREYIWRLLGYPRVTLPAIMRRASSGH